MVVTVYESLTKLDVMVTLYELLTKLDVLVTLYLINHSYANTYCVI